MSNFLNAQSASSKIYKLPKLKCKQKNERKKNNAREVQELYDNCKSYNICIMRIPDGKKKKPEKQKTKLK